MFSFLTSSQPTEPFLDPDNPDLIRCPTSDVAQISTDDLIARVVNSNIYIPNVQYDAKKRQFIVDSTKLTQSELNDRVQLAILKNGKKEQTSPSAVKWGYVDYKIADLDIPIKSLKYRLKKLAVENSPFEQSLQPSAIQKIRTYFQDTHRKQVANYTKIYNVVLEAAKRDIQHPVQKKAVDFSKMYGQEHSELNPRSYHFRPTFSSSSDEEKDSLQETPFSIHGCVIDVNGGNIKTAFTSGMREQADKEMRIQVSSPTILNKLIKYLYGMEIELSNQEAKELYQLAEQWELNPLKERCLHQAAMQDLEEIQPSKLPTLEIAGDSAEEIMRAADKTREQFKVIYATRLKPQIKRLNEMFL